MSKINGGATLWARQTIDSDIFFNKPDKWFKIWFYLITETSHKDNKQFKRGSCFLKYEWIMQKTKATKGEIDHCIRWLKSATMLATRKATGGFIVEVLNYNTFQSLESYKSNAKATAKATATAKQERNKSDTIYKNVKNDKNVIKEERDIKESGASFSSKQKTKENDPLEFSFEDKQWWGLYDWRIKMYQGAFPMLTVNYLFNDKWKTKFLNDPAKYKKMIKEKYEGDISKLVWAWLMQAKKFYIKDHPEYEEGGIDKYD